MNPSTVGSMAIVVPGLKMVIVVFPATLDSAVVIVGDVPVAVYRAVQESIIELITEVLARNVLSKEENFLSRVKPT